MMDYTTVDRLKQALKIDVVKDDALLALLVTAASRVVDVRCTGVSDGTGLDYFKLESITDELLTGQVDYNGNIICYPHKPIVNSVANFAYRASVVDTEYTVDPARIELNGMKVTAYPLNMSLEYPSRCRIRMSYTGGLSGSTVGLPADLIEVTTLIAARFYREEETGLSDQIGVAELTQLVYTKALPVRALEELETYKRRVGWRYVS